MKERQPVPTSEKAAWLEYEKICLVHFIVCLKTLLSKGLSSHTFDHKKCTCTQCKTLSKHRQFHGKTHGSQILDVPSGKGSGR